MQFDEDYQRFCHEDTDSTTYVQQRSEHAEESQSLISLTQPIYFITVVKP